MPTVYKIDIMPNYTTILIHPEDTVFRIEFPATSRMNILESLEQVDILFTVKWYPGMGYLLMELNGSANDSE